MRPEKNLLLNEIKEKISTSSAMIVAKYDKVAPNVSWSFRSALSKVGSEFEIVKKRVFQKAAQECGIALDVNALPGHIGVVFIHQDVVQSAKSFYTFNRENNDLFQVLVGRFDHVLYQASDVKALSELPSMNEMRAQFLGLLEAPMSQTLSVMESLLTSVVYCLDNKCKESK